jgi:hypothetical protein
MCLALRIIAPFGSSIMAIWCGIVLFSSLEADGLFVVYAGLALFLIELALDLLALIRPHNMIIGVNQRYINTHKHSIVYHPYKCSHHSSPKTERKWRDE